MGLARKLINGANCRVSTGLCTAVPQNLIPCKVSGVTGSQVLACGEPQPPVPNPQGDSGCQCQRPHFQHLLFLNEGFGDPRAAPWLPLFLAQQWEKAAATLGQAKRVGGLGEQETWESLRQ